MNQIGITPGNTGYDVMHQKHDGSGETLSATHTTANPTGSAAAPVATAALYPVAMVPAFVLAYPQMAVGAPFTGGQAALPAGTGGDESSPVSGGHVTANPTNSTQSPAVPGGDFSAGYGATFSGVAAYAVPVMISPVLMQLGFPVFAGPQAPVVEGEPTPPAASDDAGGDVAVPDDNVVVADDLDVSNPVVTPPAESDIIDVAPIVEDTTILPTLPITQVSADEFSKYRMIDESRSLETTLGLSLTTADGDSITLSFSQLDTADASFFKGKTLEGERVFDEQLTENSERLVNMEVVGQVSDEEMAAIDNVLNSIVEAVQGFFSGDSGAAVTALKSMDFDTSQLAELSLNMTMTRSVDVTRAYHNGGDQLHDLKNRGGDVVAALEFMASEQKRLVDLAKSVLDAPSAARLVRNLMPPLMSEPFAALQGEVAAANVLPDESGDPTDGDDGAAANGDDIPVGDTPGAEEESTQQPVA